MQENTQHYIEVKNISKKYESGNNIVNAVNDVSFYVDKGEFIGVMGSSGSGKTTILNLMSTIDTLSQGHILYDKVDIVNMKEDELSEFRKKNLGFVFQDYNLLDTLNVRENILLPMALCGNSKSEIENRIMELANSLNITDILYKFPYEISGGICGGGSHRGGIVWNRCQKTVPAGDIVCDTTCQSGRCRSCYG